MNVNRNPAETMLPQLVFDRSYKQVGGTTAYYENVFFVTFIIYFMPMQCYKSDDDALISYLSLP